MSQASPSMIGPYPVDRVLGSGGFGTVYAGRHPETGQPVAIKALDRMGGDAAAVRSQLLREAESLRAVHSSNCLQVYDVIDTGEICALVTDYIDGVSLRDLLMTRGPLRGNEALTVLWGAALGLAAVHDAGLVHGDVKPANILIENNGTSRLIDFGLATTPGWLAEDDLAPWGSPAYASPEQVEHGYRDVRSDIYSLTITLYEVLCLQRPFTGDTLEEVRWKHVHEPLPDPRTRVPDLGDELAQLLLWGTAKDPAARPQDMATFLHYFQRAAEARYGPAWWAGPSLGVLAAGLIAGGIASGVTVAGMVGGAGSAGAGVAGGLAGGFAGGASGVAGSAAAGGAGGASGIAAASGATAASTAGTGLLATTGAKVAAVVAAGVLATGGAGTAWIATDGFGQNNSSHSLTGKRAGALSVADGPRARDLYAYTELSGSDVRVIVMEKTDQVASIPLDVVMTDGYVPGPEIAWSEDGHYLAFHDVNNLYVVDSTDGTVQQRGCPGVDDGSGTSNCPASVTIWGDRIVTSDRAWLYDRSESDLVSYSVRDLDDAQLLFDSEPSQVQWQSVRAVGDFLMAVGTDSSSPGTGYRGMDPTVLYTFTPDGTATRMDADLPLVTLADATWTTPSGDPLAVVLSHGSGGACVYGYATLLVNPADPSKPAEVLGADMFTRGEGGEQEYGTINDVWTGADGSVYATAYSTVCPDPFSEDYTQEVGTPLSTWRLGGDNWVDANQTGVWSARDLPSGARVTFDAAYPISTDRSNYQFGSLTLHAGDGATQIAESVTGMSAPAVTQNSESAQGPDSDQYASDAYRTKCGSPPIFTPVASEATSTGVTITYEVHAVCPGGQWLNWSQLRVPFVVNGEYWADGYFDYASTPYWVPEGGTQHRLTYSYANTAVPYDRIAQVIDNDPNIIEVPCDAGPDNSDDGSVPTTPIEPDESETLDSTGDSPGDQDPEESALAALRRIAAEDEAAVSELDWTAQLSSKKPGTRDDGIVYDTYDKILALHLQHRARYPSTLLVWSGDWPGSYGDSSKDFWVTLSGESYTTTRPVIRWCHAEGWGDGDCWAKRLRRSGDPANNTDHAPPDKVNN